MSSADARPAYQPGTPAAADVLSVLADSATVIIIVLDAAARVCHWNTGAELTLGVPARQALGHAFADLAVAWDRDQLQALVPGWTPDCVVHLDEVRIPRRAASDRILTFTISPIPGASHGCLWHGTDITEQRAAEMHLRHTQQLESIGSLTAGIAHEINTPLQFVGDNTKFITDAFTQLGTYIDALRTATHDLPPALRLRITEAETNGDIAYLLDEVPKALAQSNDGIQRVSAIVKAMKEFSHPGTDELVATDLNHAITSTLTVSRNVWKYVADVVTDLDPTLPRVPVFPGGFNQAILNLIVNAAHAIEDRCQRDAKGTITIRTRADGGYACIDVSDTGCGMTDAVRQRIFTPFFTTKQPGRGTGQGLAIVHTEIVDRLHGHIDVVSTAGSGTIFHLRLPIRHSTVSIPLDPANGGTA